MKNIILFCASFLLFNFCEVNGNQDLTQTGNPLDQSKVQLSLKECIDRALSFYTGMKIADENLRIADQTVSAARANFFPLLSTNLSALHRKTKEGLLEGYSPFEVNFESDIYQVGISLYQPFFDGGASFAQLDMAKRSKEMAVCSVSETKSALILNVKEKYYRLFLTSEILGASREANDLSNKQLELVQNKYEIGLSPWGDVLKMKVEVARTKEALLTAESNMMSAKAELLNLMGFELDYPIKIEELPELDQEWKPALLTREELGANRVDLKRKHLEINVSEAEIRKAKASKLPKISLNSAYTWSDDKLNDIDKITDSNYNFSISVSCQFPIFDSNRTGSLIQQGKIKMENSITLYDKALDDAVLEHYKAYLSCSNALSRWQLYVDRIGEAKESVRFSTERYKVGSATLLEVIQSQVALTQVQVARSQARYDFEIALALFKKTTGRDLEDFGETNN